MFFSRRFLIGLLVLIGVIFAAAQLVAQGQLAQNASLRFEPLWSDTRRDSSPTISQYAAQLAELQDYLTRRALDIDAERQRRLAYTQLTGAALRAQQEKIRAAFISDAGLTPHEKRVADVTRVQVAAEDGYRLERVSFKNALGLSVQGLLALPENCSPTCPVLIAPNGWSSSPEAVMGYGIQDYQHAFGKKFAEAGYIVFAVNLPVVPQDFERTASIESHVAMLANLSATRYWIYMRVEPMLGALDFVETLPEADLTRIAAYGISIGGEAVLDASVLDPRINAVVVSGVNVLTPRREMLLETRRFVYSQLYDWDAFALPEVDELLATLYPRPVCIELGKYDATGNFSTALATAQRVQAIYQKERRGANFQIAVHDQNSTHDGHETEIVQCLTFLNQRLASLDNGTVK